MDLVGHPKWDVTWFRDSTKFGNSCRKWSSKSLDVPNPNGSDSYLPNEMLSPQVQLVSLHLRWVTAVGCPHSASHTCDDFRNSHTLNNAICMASAWWMVSLELYFLVGLSGSESLINEMCGSIWSFKTLCLVMVLVCTRAITIVQSMIVLDLGAYTLVCGFGFRVTHTCSGRSPLNVFGLSRFGLMTTISPTTHLVARILFYPPCPRCTSTPQVSFAPCYK